MANAEAVGVPVCLAIGNNSQGSRKGRVRLCGCCAFVSLLVLILTLVGTVGGSRYLTDSQQCLLKTRTGRSVKNGPGKIYFNAFTTTANVRSATLLAEHDYAVVTNTLTGEMRAEAGPQLLFIGAYDEIGEVQPKLVLRHDQYAHLIDNLSGELSLVRGPTALVPRPTQQLRGGVAEAWQLLQHQYIKLADGATGAVRVERGEALVFPTATEAPLTDEHGAPIGVRDAVNVDHETAALVLSRESGQQRLITAVGRFFPGALEEIVEIRSLIRVEPHQAAIVQDNLGSYTFHMGQAASGYAAAAAAAAAATAAEAGSGDVAAAGGGAAGEGSAATGQGTAFFLPPHAELVTMTWSTADGSGVAPVTLIDMRAQYAFFEYTVRTSDNVELLLEGTIFWQVVDVPTMVERTGDPRGDVWYRARSALIQEISGVTLESFMSGFNAHVTAAAGADAAFYSQRGVALLSLEVTSFACKDATTAQVLQEIIQETTNRINRLQQQRSENEVLQEALAAELELEQQRQALVQATAENERILAVAVQRQQNEVQIEALNAQIELEVARQQLVTAKAANDRLSAEADGHAQGLRYATAVEGFSASLSNETLAGAEARLALFQHFHDQAVESAQINATTRNLGAGSAHLYLTPADLNLRLYQGQPSTAAEALASSLD